MHILDDLREIKRLADEATKGDIVALLVAGIRAIARHDIELEGLSYLVLASAGHMDLYFDDSDDLWEEIISHYQLLVRDPDTLIKIFQSQIFEERHRDTHHDIKLWISRSHKTDENLRTRAGDLLDSIHKLTEQPLKHHLGLTVAASSKLEYSETQLYYISELTEIVNEYAPHITSRLANINKYRNAYAHIAYTVKDNQIIITERRDKKGKLTGHRKVITFEELEMARDRTYQALGVMTLALMLIAGRHSKRAFTLDIKPDGIDTLSVIEIEELLYAWLGWYNIDVSLTNHQRHMVISAESNVPIHRNNLLQATRVISPYGIDRMICRVSLNFISKELEIDLPVYLWTKFTQSINEPNIQDHAQTVIRQLNFDLNHETTINSIPLEAIQNDTSTLYYSIPNSDLILFSDYPPLND